VCSGSSGAYVTMQEAPMDCIFFGIRIQLWICSWYLVLIVSGANHSFFVGHGFTLFAFAVSTSLLFVYQIISNRKMLIIANMNNRLKRRHMLSLGENFGNFVNSVSFLKQSILASFFCLKSRILIEAVPIIQCGAGDFAISSYTLYSHYFIFIGRIYNPKKGLGLGPETYITIH